MGVLVGIFVTICIQSSSATTVITVGLVSAGFLTLRQAIGVIMGQISVQLLQHLLLVLILDSIFTLYWQLVRPVYFS